MKTRTYLLGVLLCLLAASCSDEPKNGGNNNPFQPIELSRSESEVAIQTNQFAWKLFNAITKNVQGNAILSPYSASVSLSMIAHGAPENVKDEIYNLLGYSSSDAESVNSYNKKLTQRLCSQDANAVVKIANSLWFDTQVEYKTPVNWFLKDLKECYGADLTKTSFKASDKGDNIADQINKWCEKTTDGVIKKALNYDDIINDSTKVEFMAINALYFNNKWKNGFNFDKTLTKWDEFTAIDGQIQKAEMMHGIDGNRLKRFGNEYINTASIPFGNGAYTFTVILPENGRTPDECIEWISANSWKEITDSMSIPFETTVIMPKLKQNVKMNLIPALKFLGIKDLFQRYSYPGFTAPGNQMVLQLMTQSNNFKLDEDGAEAVSVTTSGIGDIISPGPSFGEFFIVNRPYIYLISEESTGTILFLGKVEKL